MSEYLVIYEPGGKNWSAFSPDVPGCIATGKDREETERNFQEALMLHLELLAEDGDEIPQPSGIVAGYVAVPERSFASTDSVSAPGRPRETARAV